MFFTAGCYAGSCPGDLEQLCEKCDHCFINGVTTFESIHDIVNVALLHSNRGKLMRLRAQSVASSLADAEKREFTSAEKNYFLQACFRIIYCN